MPMDFDTERTAASLGTHVREAGEAVDEVTEKRFEQFTIDARDFLSARERGGTTGTSIEQASASLADAAEIVNRSFPERGASGQFINAISPVVIPARQSLFWRLLPIGLLISLVLSGIVATAISGALPGFVGSLALAQFGPHLWLLLIALAVFSWWRQSVVMVLDGWRAVITRFGRLEEVVEAGRTLLFNPWKQVSYIVNVAKEYPYNAPIHEARPRAGSTPRSTFSCSSGSKNRRSSSSLLAGSGGSRTSWRTP
jgi:hypothetical protein